VPRGALHIRAALIWTHGQKRYRFVDKENKVYREPYRLVLFRTSLLGSKKVTFQMPLEHIRITSPFTPRRWHPILHKYRAHHGVDFGGRIGTPIWAIADGRITYAGWMRGYGKTIKIDHGNGFVSLYGHQSALKVKRGQRVKQGQVIGLVGNTGRSTGPHLHLGLYLRGKPVDPLKYIGKSFQSARSEPGRLRRIPVPELQRMQNELDRIIATIPSAKKRR
jgi:murein DD-endopeptidase MepM/ murein hydrolase activator NlpD